MIPITNNSKISSCFFCKMQKKLVCECHSLYVSVEEHYTYKIEDLTLLKNKLWLKNYERSKENLMQQIKEKFPKAKKIKIYPFLKETLPLFSNNK